MRATPSQACPRAVAAPLAIQRYGWGETFPEAGGGGLSASAPAHATIPAATMANHAANPNQ